MVSPTVNQFTVVTPVTCIMYLATLDASQDGVPGGRRWWVPSCRRRGEGPGAQGPGHPHLVLRLPMCVVVHSGRVAVSHFDSVGYLRQGVLLGYVRTNTTPE